MNLLRSPGWRFTKDQSKASEVWGRVLRKVREEGLIYCTSDIPEKEFPLLPGVSGYEFLTPAGKKKARVRKVQEMVQNAVIYSCGVYLAKGNSPRMALIREGPYAVPVTT